MDAPALIRELEWFLFSPDGIWDASIPIAGSRAGAVGFLNLCFLRDEATAAAQIRRLMQLARGRYGLVVSTRLSSVDSSALHTLRNADTILFAGHIHADLKRIIARCRRVTRRVGLIVSSESAARQAADLGVDLVVAKGHDRVVCLGARLELRPGQRF